MKPKTLVLIAEDTGRTVPIEGTEFLIGRLPVCDLRIDDLGVSGRHCRIVRRDEHVEIEDLGSTNGTLVNDRPARHQVLHDGDRIEVGPVRYRLRIETHAASPGDADWLGEILDERARPRVRAVEADELHPESPAAIAARAVLERLSGHPAAGPAPPAAEPLTGLADLDEPDDAVEPDDVAGPAPAGGIPLVDYPAGSRCRLRFGDAEGVTLVHLVRCDLADESEVAAVSDQLGELIAAGRTRLALNCGRARHFSSQAIGALVRAHKRCQAAGGRLKLCGLGAETEQLLTLMGLQKLFEVHADDHDALHTPWPRVAEPQPSLAATLVLLGQRAADSARAARHPGGEPATAVATGPEGAERPKAGPRMALRVRLEVLVGRARHRWIEINTPHFEIGRDPSCQLRPDSPAISRRHTVIEQRSGRVFVRDLGTTNGTTVNGTTLRAAEVEVHTGDRLQVGPLLFGFEIQAKPGQDAGLEDEVARLLLGEGQAEADAPTLHLDPAAVRAAQAARSGSAPTPSSEALAVDSLARPVARREIGPRMATACRVVGPAGHEVLVVAIPGTVLDAEDTVAPVRLDLKRCQDEDLPRRVVLDLTAVRHLSSRAVGMLLTTFQQLERSGGTLRFAGVRPEILAVLEQMRVPQFIDFHPGVAAACEAPWT